MKKLKITGENEFQEQALEKLIRQSMSAEDFNNLGLLNVVILTPKISGTKIVYIGLDVAKKILVNDSSLLITLTSFESEDSLRKNDDFRFLMCLANVTFIEIADIITDFKSSYDLLKKGEKVRDDDSATIYRFNFFRDEFDSLKDELNPKGKGQSIKRGRQLGLSGSDNEIISQINNLDMLVENYFFNKSLDIALVDFDVFFEKGSLSRRRKAEVEKIVTESYRFKKDIFIISNRHFNRDVLIEEKIFYPIIYYHEFIGAYIKTLIKLKGGYVNPLIKFQNVVEI